MRARRGAALALLSLAAGTLQAADAPLPWQVEAGVSATSLSNGAPDWREADLALRSRFAPRSSAELGLRRAQRYGARDDEIALGLALPVDAAWSVALRGTAAASPRFLPRRGLELDLGRVLGDGWIAGAGFGRRLFAGTDGPPSGTGQWRVSLERYAGAWRIAGTLGRTRLDGGAGGSASGLRLQADRFFGDEARVGLIVSRGDELENAPGGVLSSRVDALVLVGRWPLAPGWALTGDLGSTRVDRIERRTGDRSAPAGAGYRRSGGRIGVQREF